MLRCGVANGTHGAEEICGIVNLRSADNYVIAERLGSVVDAGSVALVRSEVALALSSDGVVSGPPTD